VLWWQGKTTPKAPQRVSAHMVFIDAPNIENKTLEETGTRPTIDWSVLAASIDKRLKRTTPSFRAVYSSYPPNERQGKYAALEKAGFHAFYQNKDIDSRIVSDMWKEMARLDAMTYGTVDVTMVIVSGDAGYLHAFNEIQKIYGHRFRIKLWIYGWAKHTSQFLKQAAESTFGLDGMQDFAKF
jgi:hypothetical protein